MPVQPPESPEGVTNLHTQPGLETDGRLLDLEAGLESGMTDELFARFTQFLPPNATLPEQTETYRETVLDYVTNCIEYRDEIRPNSIRSLDDLPDQVSRITAGNWVRYLSDYDVDHSAPESDAKTHQSGKYLMYSPESARPLEDIILEEFAVRPFQMAKLPTKPAKQEDWVLCLYQGDNRYWYDLREEHNNPPTVRFRGFKTNQESRNDQYSDRFNEAVNS